MSCYICLSSCVIECVRFSTVEKLQSCLILCCILWLEEYTDSQLLREGDLFSKFKVEVVIKHWAAVRRTKKLAEFGRKEYLCKMLTDSHLAMLGMTRANYIKPPKVKKIDYI